MTKESKIWIYSLAFVGVIMVLSASCKKTEDGNDDIPTYKMGQFFRGGIIFYLDGTGQHGLISATSDQSNDTQWGCQGTSIGNTSTDIGMGQANTVAIVNGCSEVGQAARICQDLVLGGYDDWYLPSRDELNLMYEQRTVIGGFWNDDYWSSSEDSDHDAWGNGFCEWLYG